MLEQAISKTSPLAPSTAAMISQTSLSPLISETGVTLTAVFRINLCISARQLTEQQRHLCLRLMRASCPA